VVGIWGTFDLENYGDLLFPLIADHELTRRLGSVDLRAASPVGAHPVRFDGVAPAEALGAWEPGRLDELAARLDAVLVGGGEIIHPHDGILVAHYGGAEDRFDGLRAPSAFYVGGLGPGHERTRPVVWNAVGVPFDLGGAFAGSVRAALASRPYVAVRDPTSRDRLAAGRLAGLRARGLLPDTPYLVVQASGAVVDRAGEVADAVECLVADGAARSVAVVELGPCHGDGRFADALTRHLRVPWHRLPVAVHLLDVAAVLAGSDGYVGTSLHGALTALAYGRPTVVLDVLADGKVAAVLGELGVPDRAVPSPAGVAAAWGGTLPRPRWTELVARLDTHFDRITDLVPAGRGGRAGEGPLDRERSARAALSVRLLDERADAAGAADALVRDHDAALDRAGAELAAALAAVDRLTADLEAVGARAAYLAAELDRTIEDSRRLRSSWSWRLTAPLRRMRRTGPGPGPGPAPAPDGSAAGHRPRSDAGGSAGGRAASSGGAPTAPGSPGGGTGRPSAGRTPS
jgi:hypothetical protein